jgi:pSer/pThr/pTyr-binding forkhead associated (FHA) protein
MAIATVKNETHLLIIEDDQGRKEFILENLVYSMGRDRDCHIRLFSQFVSRHHATLVRLPSPNNSQQYYYRIVDGNTKGKPSSNGLIINGQKIPAHNLHNEDEVIFAPQIRAIYYFLQNNEIISSTDAIEYDITLINPGMNEDLEE